MIRARSLHLSLFETATLLLHGCSCNGVCLEPMGKSEGEFLSTLSEFFAAASEPPSAPTSHINASFTAASQHGRHAVFTIHKRCTSSHASRASIDTMRLCSEARGPYFGSACRGTQKSSESFMLSTDTTPVATSLQHGWDLA